MLANAQGVKTERETRVKTTGIPIVSVEWATTAFPGVNKLRWYREETSGKKSFEAKFKFNRQFFSIEFSDNGVLEDVEIDRKWKHLSKPTQEALQNTFKTFEKFKVQKIQEQWTGSSPQIVQDGILKSDLSNITVKFEIEFRAEIEGKYAIWEGLFDAKGKLLSKRRVQLRPTDNLDF